MSRHPRSLRNRLTTLRQQRSISMKYRLAAAAVAVLAATGGTALALTGGSDDTPATPASYAREDNRANRSEQRQPGATPTVTPSVTPSVKPTPKVTRTTAPKPRTTTTKPAEKVVIPSSCSAYQGNQAIACALLPKYGFAISQMPALVKLWNKESGWNHKAANPSSGAYGIPQALPGSKMGTVASDWRTNPATQIKWGLGYIKGRYGSPNNAWAFWQAHNWY